MEVFQRDAVRVGHFHDVDIVSDAAERAGVPSPSDFGYPWTPNADAWVLDQPDRLRRCPGRCPAMSVGVPAIPIKPLRYGNQSRQAGLLIVVRCLTVVAVVMPTLCG